MLGAVACCCSASDSRHLRLLCLLLHAVFSNIVDLTQLQSLAEADLHSVINQVHEYFGDFYPVGRWLFSLDMRRRWAGAVARVLRHTCCGRACGDGEGVRVVVVTSAALHRRVCHAVGGRQPRARLWPVPLMASCPVCWRCD